MTRLTENDLDSLGESLNVYDKFLTNNFHTNLKDIAVKAANLNLEIFQKKSQEISVAVIPITAGKGIIGNFSLTVGSIINYLGYNAFITKNTDVAGISEGISKGAKILFMADDEQFIALNITKGTFSDNAEATAKGFVTALNLAANGLKDKQVLVIGIGNVGSHALKQLQKIGATVAAYDINQEKINTINENNIIVEKNITNTLNKYKYIVDATPKGNFLDLKCLHPDVIIAAPGMPLGLTKEAYTALKNRVIHDPLQIGVATMLAMSL
jgi:pyrrolysine biosynthesis protein PylD